MCFINQVFIPEVIPCCKNTFIEIYQLSLLLINCTLNPKEIQDEQENPYIFSKI